MTDLTERLDALEVEFMSVGLPMTGRESEALNLARAYRDLARQAIAEIDDLRALLEPNE